MAAVAAAVSLALAGSLFGAVAAPVKVALDAAGHTPKIGLRWYYTVRVTEGGKPVAAKLSEQIVDPLGGSHPVEFGNTTKKITNWPFTGSFRDFIIWPADSRGIPLTFRVVVTVGRTSHVVRYSVTARG
jgi:hypothetical protein